MEFALYHHSQNMKVELREVTQDTVRAICDLRVSKEQEQFVAPNSVSIAEAHFSEGAWFRAVYADETPVGFVLLAEVPREERERLGTHFLWRFMIDERYQGRDYGRRALESVIQHLEEETNANALYTSCREGKGSPKGFYKKMGFRETGKKLDNGERILKLKITG
ncbi:GNAT family N-acetyltransferase [Candidatus Bathyarchaeota archaeon]|nr:GNAT family N-acetyltransferase [Candidatus Bathyarchaeota archaeon]